jgi:hypothetical protein
VITLEARNSGAKGEWLGWTYPATHEPLRDGRVLSYWIKATMHADTRSGVAVMIRWLP